MERHDRQLPMHTRTLGDIATRCQAYSKALQLEFHDKEMLRWTEAELMRRRTEDLKKLQDVVVHATSLLATARNDAVKMCAQRLVEIAEELIALRYKRSAEMQQQVLTLTIEPVGASKGAN